MATITTRIGKGDPLTFTEMDTNLTNLNTDKLENINSESIGDLSNVDITTSPPTDGQALVWQTTTNKFLPGTAGGGSTNLNALTDVDTSSTANGDILMYDGANTKFVASSQYTGTGTTINGMVSSIDTARTPNTITLTGATTLVGGNTVTFTGSNVSAIGLNSATTYYIWASVGAGTFELSTANPSSGTGSPLTLTSGSVTAINFTATASGTAGFLLNNLGDVTTNYPTNGQVLKYNSGTSIWEAGQVDLSNSQLQNLSDVNSGMSLTNGNVLTYDTTQAKWTASAPSGGGGSSVIAITPNTSSYQTPYGQVRRATLTETFDSTNIGSNSTTWVYTLPAGTYVYQAGAAGGASNGPTVNLYNDTGGANIFTYNKTASIQGIFTLSQSSDLDIRWTNNGYSPGASMVIFTKVA